MSKNNQVHFKQYHQGQVMLLPPSLDELIDKNHPVRTVSRVLDEIDIDALLKKYKGGGTTSYHPRMMLKVMVYAYLNNEYSSRRMEAALKENIHFMWLSGQSQPDHNTLNRFRSERLKGVLKKVFAQVVELLNTSGHLSLKEVYTDGTKIEANANRYTFVWGKAIKTNKEKMATQLKELWNYAEHVAGEELKDKTPITFEPIDPEQVRQTIEKIDEALLGKPVSKEVKQKLNYAKKNWPQNTARYNEQEKILDERNSYSKTDPDATFMRMKEDHMQNGQLKPAYNIQFSSSNQFIVNYSLHQTTTDTTTLKQHLTSHKELFGKLPETLTADAGYGSHENYELLEAASINAYVKYNYFDKEQQKKQDPFKTDNLHYNKDLDCYYCPMGQMMKKVKESTRKTATGFEQKVTHYQAARCAGCPLRGVCHSAKGNRTIEVNHALKHYKEKARKNLLSEEGIAHRKKRCYDIEPVFANIKHNKKFKRFHLRSIHKAEIETALIAISHNLKKMAA